MLLIRNKSLKQRRAVSKSHSGINNPMYGKTPWNKGMKGLQPWHNISGFRPNPDTQFKKGSSGFKGKHTLETRIKISKVQQKTGLWQGFKRSRDYLERRKFKQQMQRMVFERDNYTCQMCGSGGDLQVDHIQSWSEYIELRFSMDNCRTLCVKCHYKITFGKPMPKNIKGWGHNFLKGGNLK